MTGRLHALIEDAARDAGCTVAQMRGTLHWSRPEQVSRRRSAFLRAAEMGFSREQTARVFGVTKRTVVRGIKEERSSPISTLSTGESPRKSLEGHV